MFTLDPSTNQYDQTQASALFDRVATSLGTLPHVTAVTFSSQPLLRNAWSSKELHAQGAAPGTAAQSAYSIAVQEDFFTTMRIRLLAGRAFDTRDVANGPPVAILSATLARRMFGDLNAVGRRFGVDDDATSKFEVVGVVADTRPVSLRTESPITVYWPHRQSPEGARTFLLRTSAAPEAMMPIIRKAMERIDPAMPLIDLSTQASAFDDQWVRERTTAVASGTLGLLALLVSMVGLFGLASYAVTRRSKEIAIRMAVGADAPGVLRSVLRDSLVLVAVGISIGLGLSVLTTRFLSTLLFDLTPNDPAVIAAAVLMMFVVASLAGYLPARRAARIDPITALREE
jgi:predicted permease